MTSIDIKKPTLYVIQEITEELAMVLESLWERLHKDS